MPLAKNFIATVCIVMLAVSSAPAREKYSLLQDQQPDTTTSDEKFDSFLENLINKIQTNIAQSLTKKEPKDTDAAEQFGPEDSLDIVTGDYEVPGNETEDRDIYVKDGNLTVAGMLRGNASVLRGSIIVKDGGRITGNAHAIGGTVIREKNGIVEGEIRESSSDGGYRKRYIARKRSYTFTPRWLHENLYSDNFVFRYNRVEGVYVGLASEKKFYWDGHRLVSGYGSLGYGFADHRWRGQLGVDRQFATGTSLFEIGAEGHNLTDTKDDWIISQGENTAAAFLLKEDYRDYYERAGASGHVAWYTKAPGLMTMINAEYRYDEYKSMEKNTNWSLFKNKYPFRENPSVFEGPMNSGVLTAGISTVEKQRRSTVGWNVFAQLEIGRVGNDFGGRTHDKVYSRDFTHAVVDVRRFQPLSQYDNLNMRVRFGSYKGELIEQKTFELGGVNTLPAFGFKEFAGNRMVLGNLEYALNGRIFDDVHFWPGFLTLILFADAGTTQVADVNTEVTDGFNKFALSNLKSDLGFALGWHDGTARVGFAWRTDKADPPMVFLRLSKPF